MKNGFSGPVAVKEIADLASATMNSSIMTIARISAERDAALVQRNYAIAALQALPGQIRLMKGAEGNSGADDVMLEYAASVVEKLIPADDTESEGGDCDVHVFIIPPREAA